MDKAGEAAMDADLEAMERCLAGDREAFAGLIERHKKVVYSLARHMLGDETEAEDIAQEAFVKAYFSLAKFRRECSFRNWLCQIATRLCIDHLRARRPERKVILQERVMSAGEDGPAEAIGKREMVRTALERLPAYLRAPVVLRHLEELSYQEMAEILRLPLGTVKTRLRRGRAALKKELEGLRREEARVGEGVKEV